MRFLSTVTIVPTDLNVRGSKHRSQYTITHNQSATSSTNTQKDRIILFVRVCFDTHEIIKHHPSSRLIVILVNVAKQTAPVVRLRLSKDAATCASTTSKQTAAASVRVTAPTSKQTAADGVSSTKQTCPSTSTQASIPIPIRQYQLELAQLVSVCGF